MVDTISCPERASRGGLRLLCNYQFEIGALFQMLNNKGTKTRKGQHGMCMCMSMSHVHVNVSHVLSAHQLELAVEKQRRARNHSTHVSHAFSFVLESGSVASSTELLLFASDT